MKLWVESQWPGIALFCSGSACLCVTSAFCLTQYDTSAPTDTASAYKMCRLFRPPPKVSSCILTPPLTLITGGSITLLHKLTLSEVIQMYDRTL